MEWKWKYFKAGVGRNEDESEGRNYSMRMNRQRKAYSGISCKSAYTAGRPV